MENNPLNYYSMLDHSKGLCRIEQIGMLKPEALWVLESAQEPTPSDHKPYASKLQELSEAAMDTVLSHPGGAKKWFQENPAAHTKLLVKLATPIEQSTGGTVNVNISWLDPQRLSYKTVEPTSEAIEDVSPKGWKDQSETTKVLGEIAKIDAVRK